MFTLTKKIVLTSLAIQVVMAPIMVGTVESFAHPSIQTRNETKTMVSSPVDWNVDKKKKMMMMKPLVVPSFASTVMDVILSITTGSKDIYDAISRVRLSQKTLAFMVPAAFSMMVAAILASFLQFIAMVTVLGCKIFHQALKNVHLDKNVKIFDIDLSDFDYEVTNVMAAFDPSSLDLWYSVNEGIHLDASMAVDAAFIGPAFVEIRHPPTESDKDELSIASVANDSGMEDALLPLATIYVDHHDDYEEDESSIGFGDDATYDEIFPEPVAMVPTAVLDSIFVLINEEEAEPIKMFQDFCEFREPQTDFDEDDEDFDTTDDFDSQMEDLLFSFSKLSFKDNSTVKKTVSDSEMDELSDAFAKL